MRRVALLALLLVLAGCSSPFGGTPETTETPEPTTAPETTDAPDPATNTAPSGGGETETGPGDGRETTTSDGDGPSDGEPLVAVEGPDVDANASDLFLRTRALLDADTEPPRVVVTRSPDVEFPTQEASTFRALFLPSVDPDVRRDGGDRGSWPTASPAFYYPDSHTVYINPLYVDNRQVDIEEILVEEFAHAVQFRNETFRAYYDPLVDGLRFRSNVTTDQRLTVVAVREGVGDVYVTARVQQESLGVPSSQTIASAVDTRYDRLGVGFRLGFGAYLFGYQYADRRIDTAPETFGVYADPPRTGEQVLHDTDEGPTNLSVRVGDDLERARTNTYGELFLRPALSAGLDRSEAARAADGWGNDRLLNLTLDGPSGPTNGFVWVLDWDDAEERLEFQRLFRRYLEDRGLSVGDGRFSLENRQWTLRKVDDDTVAVVIGPSSFLDAVETTAGDDDGTVVIRTSTTDRRFGATGLTTRR